MIVVCEPQCKGISHEKVNAGYIYGLLLAYPKEKILFFAETTHFREVESILKDAKISTKRLKNVSINFNSRRSFSIFGILQYYFLFKKIFDKTLSLGQRKIFFLSGGSIIIYVVKKLKQQNIYRDLCFTFVLHGELEDIANIDYKEPYVPGVKNQLKFTLSHPGVVLLFVRTVISKPFIWLGSKYSLIFKRIFRTKKIMMWRHSSQYNYISMSPHVTKNAKKYLDTNYLNFYTIILPIVFTKTTSTPNNNFIKFAVFGYGDSTQMHKMLNLLSKKKVTRPYEIRIISMDSRGTEGFPNVTRLSNGKILSRIEMEDSVRDIDVFINLYDKTRHRFGCSLSILESLSYLKPILHLSNPGYNYFNKPEKPIGFRAENLNEFVDKMCDMIGNYPKYKKQLSVFRKNMLEYRKEYNIASNLPMLKKSLTFC